MYSEILLRNICRMDNGASLQCSLNPNYNVHQLAPNLLIEIGIDIGQRPYLDLNLVKGLSVVDPDDGASHLGNDDHVPEVRLDDVRLLVWRRLLLLLPELLDERHRFPLEATRKLPPDAAREQLHQLLVVHVQQLVEVDAAVRVLAEGTLLLESLSGLKGRRKSTDKLT